MTDEPTRARVRRAIGDIVEGMRAHRPDAREPDDPADHAVLRTYLAADELVPDDDGVAGAALGAAVDQGRAAVRPALFGGVARIGWTIAHLADGDDAETACAAIDQAIARLVPGWSSDYDLIGGVVGFGVYAVERGPAGAPLARAVLDHLERTARPRLGGLAWFTRPELLVDAQRAIAPDGYWNLGVAHGMPGVIGVLARFVAARIEPTRSRTLLDGAVAHLLAAEPKGERGRFPPWQPRDAEPSRRLAWCYGDLGVAAVLLSAALLVDQRAWRAEALELARACARRTVDDAAIADAGLCHGAAGIGHIFNRIAQATGDAELAAAARRWIDHTLALQRDAPIAGFPMTSVEDGVMHHRADATILSGAPGVGLALHAAISEVEPGWDRLLLLDLPVAGP